jgi:hypothetical protein
MVLSLPMAAIGLVLVIRGVRLARRAEYVESH